MIRPSLSSFRVFVYGLGLFAGAFIPQGTANAATHVVGNCNDSGTGSLRNAVAIAASGDLIDLRPLTCSRILLTSGQLLVPQSDLTVIGRSRYAMTVDGNRSDRVFLHTGGGTLRLEHVSIANGLRALAIEPDRGGCIRSDGNVELHRARVHGCGVHSEGWIDSFPTTGGGISALGDVVLTFSAVFNSFATEDGTGGGIAAGGHVTLYRSQIYNNFSFRTGGVFAPGGATVTYSLIHNNRATFGGGGLGVGREGALGSGDLFVNKSTISHNVLDDFDGRNIGARGGGIRVLGTGRSTIIDSTISGNRAHLHSAAFIQGGADIYNSTIAFNVEIETIDQDFPTTPCIDRGALSANALHLESTIVAKNGCTLGPVGYDIAALTSITGADNLIGRSRVPVPTDTISADPRLAPLAENGGPTRTHLLLADSPAIDRGSNPLDRAYDQRGPGFPRVKGAFPDIGAIER